MQAIARSETVSTGQRIAALIVDYNGMPGSLRKALADYAGNVEGTDSADSRLEPDSK